MRWWGPTSWSWPLHPQNDTQLNYLRQRLHEHFGMLSDRSIPPQRPRLLELGCWGAASSILSESITRLAARVDGADMVDENIHITWLHTEQLCLPVDYRIAMAEAGAAADARYDAVPTMAVVEHVAVMSLVPAITLPLGACRRPDVHHDHHSDVLILCWRNLDRQTCARPAVERHTTLVQVPKTSQTCSVARTTRDHGDRDTRRGGQPR